jgi:hypothetical protein
MPCPNGKRLDIKDNRTDAQHAEAKQLASAQMRQAYMLEKERMLRDAPFLNPKAGRLSAEQTSAQTTLQGVSVLSHEHKKPRQRHHVDAKRTDFKVITLKSKLEKKKK